MEDVNLTVYSLEDAAYFMLPNEFVVDTEDPLIHTQKLVMDS